MCFLKLIIICNEGEMHSSNLTAVLSMFKQLVVQETAYCEDTKGLVIWNFKYLIYVTFTVIPK